jgi:hypothetical protein
VHEHVAYHSFSPPCIAFMLVSHSCIFVIDHVEQERAEPPEPAPVEDADYEKDQGKPSASNRNP